MTLAEIQARVDAIRAAATGDPEVAHSMEDALHRDVLAEIVHMGAVGMIGYRLSDPWHFAAAALATVKVEFPRYMA